MSRLRPPVSEDDHIRGNPRGLVTLLEFGDYECPYCGRAHPVVNEVMRQLGPALRTAYRHFPLTQIHPHALTAAYAAEAAGAQGRFWEMHDTLFENQDALAVEDLIGYAETLGLDVQRFAADLAAGTQADKVRRDIQSGIRSGVNGTPTFFIDDVRWDGAWDVDSLVAGLLAAARVKQRQAPLHR